MSISSTFFEMHESLRRRSNFAWCRCFKILLLGNSLWSSSPVPVGEILEMRRGFARRAQLRFAGTLSGGGDMGTFVIGNKGNDRKGTNLALHSVRTPFGLKPILGCSSAIESQLSIAFALHENSDDTISPEPCCAQQRLVEK
jgi:hypothetical protein